MDAESPILRQLDPARAVWAVAWPVSVHGLVRAVYLLVDAYWVGRLGDAAVAGLAIASFAWWIVLQLADLGPLGTHTLTAQAEGGGRRSEVGTFLAQGVWISLSVWFVAVSTHGVWSTAYLDALGAEPGSVPRAEASAWMWAMVVGSGCSGAHMLVASVFRGLGDTRTALAVAGASLLLNAGLDPLFILGVGSWSGLGIAGAAWATALSELAAAGVGLALLTRRHLDLHLAWPEAPMLRRILEIGTPVAISAVGFSLVYVVLGRMISAHGAEHMAALGVGHRVEFLFYFVAAGFMVGTSTMVGQQLGAGRPEAADETARISARLCTVLMLMGTAPAMFGAEWLYSWFVHDPDTIQAGSNYLRIQSLVWVFMGL